MTKQIIAVIVAHPDDEVLGFGGIMAKHAEKGDEVHVLILATGLASRSDNGFADSKKLDELQNQSKKACEILGAKTVTQESFPDNSMDSVALLDVVKNVEAFINKIKPQAVYTHHIGDLNIDHRITHQAVLTACRPLPDSYVRRIMAGEILSSSEYADPNERFIPNVYVNIEDTIERKREALKQYKAELRNWPHPRSIAALENLAAVRGSECGCKAAEAYILIREVL